MIAAEPVVARASLPFGANPHPEGTEFRVWAPRAERVDLEFADPSRPGASWSYLPLTPEGGGVFSAVIADVPAGSRYKFRLNGADSFPDPWSRAQPDGVHGASEVVDPTAFRWTDARWGGITRDHIVLYELHVGTFTTAGTFDAVIEVLPRLRRLGVTAIEVMPIAEFPGRRGWGYDGVDLFAPSRNYGGVMGFKRLVDAAHRIGLGVVLDVVYNHFGPDGNYLRAYSEQYFSDRHTTPWGEALNFDGPGRERVREFFVQNACYWISEYHVDGLRLDATQAVQDTSPTHILAELADAARRAAGPNRTVYIAAEDNRNLIDLVRPRSVGGMGLDAVWADDFHHAMHTLLTGEHEAYYADFDGTAETIAQTIAAGFYYQGQPSILRGTPRGSQVTDEPASAFVFCLQNHDQVGNRGLGERLHHLVDNDRISVATTLFLLSPEAPLLFMGQEFGATSPFQYFTDHHPALGKLVTEGRRNEFRGLLTFRDPARQKLIPDPQSEDTFLRSRLDQDEGERNHGLYRLHAVLLRMRRQDPVFAFGGREELISAALGPECVVLRRWLPTDSESSDSGERRLIIANFGPALDVRLDEPGILDWLAADRWRLLLSTASSRFSGHQRRWSRRQTRQGVYLTIPAATALVFTTA